MHFANFKFQLVLNMSSTKFIQPKVQYATLSKLECMSKERRCEFFWLKKFWSKRAQIVIRLICYHYCFRPCRRPCIACAFIQVLRAFSLYLPIGRAMFTQPLPNKSIDWRFISVASAITSQVDPPFAYRFRSKIVHNKISNQSYAWPTTFN